MAKICPLCNKIKDTNEKCKSCGNSMVDMGRVQDYSDPYGPQDPINDADNYCVHLFKCENCGNKESSKVSKVNI
jgi:hypothetical protein